MAAERLLEWSDVVRELTSFVAAFITVGAVGFRYGVLRRRVVAAPPAGPGAVEVGDASRAFGAYAAEVAGRVGLTGAVLQVVLFIIAIRGTAARKHVSVGEAI